MGQASQFTKTPCPKIPRQLPGRLRHAVPGRPSAGSWLHQTLQLRALLQNCTAGVRASGQALADIPFN